MVAAFGLWVLLEAAGDCVGDCGRRCGWGSGWELTEVDSGQRRCRWVRMPAVLFGMLAEAAEVVLGAADVSG